MFLKKFLLIISVAACIVMTGCGNGETFTISGIVNGAGTQNLRIGYVDNGTAVNNITVAVDGKFRYEGSASQPIVVSIFSSSRKLIGCVYVKNGDAIEGEWDIDKPYEAKVKGNSESSDWAEFLKENSAAFDSDDYKATNEAIGKYVESHKDNVVSTLLMITNYNTIANEHKADSLFNLIDPTARPDALVASYRQMLTDMDAEMMTRKLLPLNLYAGEDSTITLRPTKQSVALLYFSGVEDRGGVVPKLRRLTNDYPEKRLRIIDISFAPDTTAWRNSTRRDSASWDECWAVGATGNKAIEYLSIPRTPYFVVADSTGTQLYRGSSIVEAEKVIDTALK